tara:strand:+ start:589 stop:837 length:249 start_codon:yes stop_codon:yes gene_type:complete
MGIIAQDLEKIYPYLVETRTNGYKAIRYDRLIALLIESIKTQQLQLNELEKDSHPPQEYICCRKCGCKIAKTKKGDKDGSKS